MESSILGNPVIACERKALRGPKYKSPLCTRLLSDWSFRIKCRNFGPPKWALKGVPVIFHNFSPNSLNSFAILFARLSCQLIAGVTGWQVLFSQKRNVDLWTASPARWILVLPDVRTISWNSSFIALRNIDGSLSTWNCLGLYNSCLILLVWRNCPCALNKNAFVDDVPWSMTI